MSFEPADRELCPDGACVGLIGPDGRCKECGMIAPSANTHSRLRGMRPDPDEPSPPGDEADRELCPDGACVGLIGPDGRCKECGRAAERGASLPAAAPPSARTPVADDDASDDLEQRELCPDGMCIGVIGPDGYCKVCGAPGE